MVARVGYPKILHSGAGFCVATEMLGNLGGCAQPKELHPPSPSTQDSRPDLGKLAPLTAAGVFSAKPRVLPSLRSNLRTIFFVLVAGSMLAPLFLVASSSGAIPQLQVGLALRHEAVEAAQSFARSIILSPAAPLAFLAAESEASRTVVVPLFQHTIDGGGAALTLPGLVPSVSTSFEWRSWVGIDRQAIVHCAPCLAILSAVSARPLPGPRLGTAQPPLPPHNRGPDLARLVRWDRQLELVDRGHALLRQRLILAAASGAASAFLQGWVDRVASGPQGQHLPLKLRDPDDSSDVGLKGRPFSARYSPVTTNALPQPQSQFASAFRPRGLADLLEPKALSRLHEFLAIQSSNLVAIRRFGTSVERAHDALRLRGFGRAVQHLDPLVIGQDEFVPAARGIIWDCRNLEEAGFCSPLEYATPPNSDLNSAYILERYGPTGTTPWPDQELVSQVVFGVQFQADLPLQIVLLPHLVSLPLGFTSVDKEINTFVEHGWYQRTIGLPFVPIRAMGKGAAARKSDPSRFRRTTDGGGPRQPVFDGQGVQAVSFNDAIGLRGTRPLSGAEDGAVHGDPFPPKWPASEVKPRIEDLMHDAAVLRHAALTVFHEPLVGFTDDFARYFTQFPVHPSEQWKTNLVWTFPDELPTAGLGASFSFVTEKRLGFGLSLSPSVAQRFSELVLADFRSRLDAVENDFFESILSSSTGACHGNGARDLIDAAGRADGMSAACRWVQQRRSLSRLTSNFELRLYSAHLYTDDIAVVVVGHRASSPGPSLLGRNHSSLRDHHGTAFKAPDRILLHLARL